MKYFFVSLLLVLTACSNADSTKTANASSGTSESNESPYASLDQTVFIKWDGEKFRLDDGDSFQMNEKHLIRDKYPKATAVNLTLVRPGLRDKLPTLISEFEDIGFNDVSFVESAALYDNGEKNPPVEDRPYTLNVYLTDVIEVSDKSYDYDEIDSFIDQMVLLDPRIFTVVLNVSDPNDPNFERIVDEINDLGFKTFIQLSVAK